MKDSGLKDKQLAISKSLIQIKKHNPVLLVDGDAAGNQMKITNKDSELLVVSLKDINPNFKLIESLFDTVDLETLEIIKKNGKYIKHSSTSSIIKTFIEEYNFTENTIANFKSLFDYILNL